MHTFIKTCFITVVAIALSCTVARAQYPDYLNIQLQYTMPLYGRAACLAFSPDGRLVAAGMNGKAFVWNKRGERVQVLYCGARPKEDEGDPLRLPAELDQWLTRIAFSADGKRLAASCSDGTVRLWNLETATQTLLVDPDAAREFGERKSHVGPVLCVAFSPDGMLLASGGADRFLKVWNMKSDVLSFRVKRPAGVSEVAFSDDGQEITDVAAMKTRPWNCIISHCEASTGVIRKSLTFPFGSGELTVLSPGGNVVLRGSVGTEVWNTENGDSVPLPWPGPPDAIRYGAMGFDEELAVFVCGSDRTVSYTPDGWRLGVCNVRTGEVLLRTYGHPRESRGHWPAEERTVRVPIAGAIALSPDNRSIALFSVLDNAVQLWTVP